MNERLIPLVLTSVLFYERKDDKYHIVNVGKGRPMQIVTQQNKLKAANKHEWQPKSMQRKKANKKGENGFTDDHLLIFQCLFFENK